MFSKLKDLLTSEPEKEFRPRVQKRPGTHQSRPSSEPQKLESSENSEDADFGGKGILIGYDYLKKSGQQDDEQTRIQSKLELIKQLKKELGHE